MKKVSVIMGIYDCERTLAAAIESMVVQTYTDWELIMCDDGSKDRTYEIAKAYCDKYPDRMILLKNEVNQKLAATLNRCLSVARGEYIARMDADDECLPERLRVQVDFLDRHLDYDCVGTSRVIFDQFGERGYRINSGEPKVKTLITDTPFAHPTIMVRKRVYDILNGYTVSEETRRAEDLDLWFRFYANGFRGYNLDKVLYRYRESKIDFKKRSLSAAIGTAKVFLRGYRLLGFSHIYDFCALKPILMAVIPNWIMHQYHKHNDRRKA